MEQPNKCELPCNHCMCGANHLNQKTATYRIFTTTSKMWSPVFLFLLSAQFICKQYLAFQPHVSRLQHGEAWSAQVYTATSNRGTISAIQRSVLTECLKKSDFVLYTTRLLHLNSEVAVKIGDKNVWHQCMKYGVPRMFDDYTKCQTKWHNLLASCHRPDISLN